MPIKYDDVVKTRILFCGTDASVEGNTYTFQLPVPIQDVIHIEILATNKFVEGLLIQIDGWGSNVTSAGRLYWRYVDTNSNQRFEDWQTTETVYREPQTLRNMTLSLWYADSSPVSTTEAVSFGMGELVVVGGGSASTPVVEIVAYSLKKQ